MRLLFLSAGIFALSVAFLKRSACYSLAIAASTQAYGRRSAQYSWQLLLAPSMGNFHWFTYQSLPTEASRPPPAFVYPSSWSNPPLDLLDGSLHPVEAPTTLESLPVEAIRLRRPPFDALLLRVKPLRLDVLLLRT